MNLTRIKDLRNSRGDARRFEEMACLRETLIQGRGEAHLAEHYAVLLEVSRTISSDLSLDILLPNLVEVITRTLRAERATLFLHDPTKDELYSHVMRGEKVEEIKIPAKSGIAGAVFSDQEVLNIPDAYADPRFNREVDKKTGYLTRNILCAPLRNRAGHVIGVTQVLNKYDGCFDAADAALLETLTAHAATALEHARLFEELRRSRQEQAELMELMTAISQDLNLETLIGAIIEGTTKLLGAERGTFLLHDDKSDELWSVVAEGVHKKEIRIPCTSGIAGWTFSKNQVVNVANAYADPRFDPTVDRDTGYRTRNILSMPVRNKLGRTIGVTQVLNKLEGSFTGDDERRLKAFSAQVVAAVENAQLFNEVLELNNFNEGILRSLTNGVVTLDANAGVTKLNAAACRILAVDESDVVGRNLAACLGDDNPWIVKSLDHVARTGKTDFHLDTDLRQASGATVSVNLHVAPLFNVEGDPVGSMLVLEDITREKRVRGTMSRYMAKEVVEQLLEGGEEVLEGTDQEATILFSDIRGFAGISERLGTRKTVKLLNEYFSEMVDVIFSHGGILDKYIGDGIMAVFGAPVGDSCDAGNAITVANEMMRSLRTLNARWSNDGEKPIEIGIGVSTGQVLAGSIGCQKRMEYTVIGDSVNLAARLESANKYYGTKILLGANTVERLGLRKNLREIDLMRAKGFANPVAIYEIMEHYPEEILKKLLDVVPFYQDGLAAYRAQQWENAIRLFGTALGHHPEDGPSQVLLNRCVYYKNNPPPESWDGVWTMREK